ncbi:hypothetical protein FRC17_005424 [Serendipita sp. 399]|nr:hypothetical protein FRC17_005424 [Serendipita sp. 399]
MSDEVDREYDTSPPPYPTQTISGNEKHDSPVTHEIVETINVRINELSPALRELSLKIHGMAGYDLVSTALKESHRLINAIADHPELGFKEYYAHDTLTASMESYGFDVTRHYLGLETAWRAEFKYRSSASATPEKSSPVHTLGINSEMDALPAIGHACGHNLIAIAGVAIALAAKTVLEKHDLDGNIVLLGTPAEEGGAGKVRLIERGGYKDMDVCIMCHPGPGPKNTSGVGPSLSLTGIEVEYFGHTAHASAAPWEGKNALDAAFLAYSAVSVLRQQIKPTHRVHGIVEGRDWAANIIPDYAKMKWYVRAPSAAEVEVLKERVINCFKAAALSTGCKMELRMGETMFDLRQNGVLAQEYLDIIKEYNMGPNAVEGAIGGSTDFLTVSSELPSLHPSYAIPTTPNGGNHTRGFADAAKTKTAHECTLRVSKALTQSGIRTLIDEKFLTEVKGAFNPNK